MLGVLTLVYLISLMYICSNSSSSFLLLPVCRTIIYLSIVYTIGQVVLAISAIHDITDTNKDGTPNNMNFHMWVEHTLIGMTWAASNTDACLLIFVCVCVLLSVLCPWWVWSSLPWGREASNPVWLPLAGTSFRTIRLGVNQAHARIWCRLQDEVKKIIETHPWSYGGILCFDKKTPVL